nr:hypothetical protein [Candidatus Sigynarchaeota archaeon]
MVGVSLIVVYSQAPSEGWLIQWNSTPSTSYAYDIAEKNGDVYIVGATDTIGNGGYDSLIIKYTSDGTQAWAKDWGGILNEWGYCIALNNSSIFISGFTESFGYKAFLAKYDGAGNREWNVTFTSSFYPSKMVVNGSCFYISGGNGQYRSSSSRAFLGKYNATGGLIWEKWWDQPSIDDFSYSIAVIGDNVYVVGSSESGVNGTDRAFLAKFDASGNSVWNRTIDYNHTTVAYDIKADGTSLLISGEMTDGIDPDYHYLADGPDHAFIARYDQDGNQDWNATFTSLDKSGARSIYLNGGHIYIGSTTYLIACNMTGQFLWSETLIEWSRYGFGLAFIPNSIEIAGEGDDIHASITNQGTICFARFSVDYIPSPLQVNATLLRNITVVVFGGIIAFAFLVIIINAKTKRKPNVLDQEALLKMKPRKYWRASLGWDVADASIAGISLYFVQLSFGSGFPISPLMMIGYSTFVIAGCILSFVLAGCERVTAIKSFKSGYFTSFSGNILVIGTSIYIQLVTYAVSPNFYNTYSFFIVWPLYAVPAIGSLFAGLMYYYTKQHQFVNGTLVKPGGEAAKPFDINAIQVTRGFEVAGDCFKFFIRVQNNFDRVITKVKVQVILPATLKLDEKSPSETFYLELIKPTMFATAIYYFYCVACSDDTINASVAFFDPEGNLVTKPMEPFQVKSCKFIKPRQISKDGFDAKLAKADKKEIQIPLKKAAVDQAVLDTIRQRLTMSQVDATSNSLEMFGEAKDGSDIGISMVLKEIKGIQTLIATVFGQNQQVELGLLSDIIEAVKDVKTDTREIKVITKDILDAVQEAVKAQLTIHDEISARIEEIGNRIKDLNATLVKVDLDGNKDQSESLQKQIALARSELRDLVGKMEENVGNMAQNLSKVIQKQQITDDMLKDKLGDDWDKIKTVWGEYKTGNRTLASLLAGATKELGKRVLKKFVSALVGNVFKVDT